jgi:exopolysaccharide biosynthesis polyprenyl glycosylphosphotransferase
MATSDFWQRVSDSVASPQDWPGTAVRGNPRAPQGRIKMYMVLDVVTILVSVVAATIYRRHTGAVLGARQLWHGTLVHGRPMGILLGLVCFFAIALLMISKRMNLYMPARLNNALHEQRLSMQACLTSGLLLTGTLYLLHAEDVSRIIVLMTVGLTAVLLGMRRLLSRLFLYHGYKQGVGTRNVLIVGTGPEAQALRHHLESLHHLGYSFRGFIELPSAAHCIAATPSNVVGSLDSLFQQVRKQFVDEVFFTAPYDRGLIQDALSQARVQGVDLRIVPEMYDGLTWNNPVEYIGQFPTIPLHRGDVPEVQLVFKRVFDTVISALALTLLSPLLLALAIAIKLDSSGPVFYLSERIGKKGRAFRCIKFRTMIQGADRQRAKMMHLNERDGVLFKISDDPRITKLGRFLRKYSLDELPQFFNVLRGDMSIVGPRPPMGSEVREYKLSHLRRLDVTPGITGLWQVQARQDPSFDSYISLDVTYIENWSIWLDIHIIMRTIGVVFAGTGS